MTQDKELEFYKNLQIMSKVYAEIEKDKSTLAELSEQKNKLQKYLCAALPYGVKCQFDDGCVYTLSPRHLEFFKFISNFNLKPYLRPMSSMTDEERTEYKKLIVLQPTDNGYDWHEVPTINALDWLLHNHFDFMGLIPMGAAIAVTEENNPYKN